MKNKSKVIISALFIWMLMIIGLGVVFNPFLRNEVIRIIIEGKRVITKNSSKAPKQLIKFDIPEKYTIHGIDVSHHQGKIDWGKVKEAKLRNYPVSFVIIKATEGTNFLDHKFTHNWKSIQDINKIKGAYHFFRPKANPELQAKHYINTVKLQKGDLPPIVDVEVTDGKDTKTIRKNLKTFIGIIEKHYKVKPIIYSSPMFYKHILGNDFKDYPFWVSHFGVKNPAGVDKKWQLWQYTEHGKIDGIKGRIDLNVFCCEEVEFKKLLVKLN
jgi:lysozyme